MNNAIWADALSCLSGDGPIYIAGCCGEPTAFLDALEHDPNLARKRIFTGVWIPGVNIRFHVDFSQSIMRLITMVWV